MKRFIFLSVIFLFIGTVAQAQITKPNKVQVEKKPTTTTAVGKNESAQTKKAKLPTKRAVTTRISMQATSFKKRGK